MESSTDGGIVMDMNTITGMFTLGWQDIGKGFVMSVLGAIVTYIYQAMAIPGFSFFTVDWSAMLHIGLLAGIAYLIKNFLSTDDGKFAGVIG